MHSMRMTEKQKKFLDRHVRLMYFFIKNNIVDIPLHLRDDFVSDLAWRFCFAGMGFDEELGFKFSTYAYGGFRYCVRDVTDRKRKLYWKNHFRSQEDVWSIVNRTPAIEEKHVEEATLHKVIL